MIVNNILDHIFANSGNLAVLRVLNEELSEFQVERKHAWQALACALLSLLSIILLILNSLNARSADVNIYSH
jgi:hypothetical protein